MNNKSLIAGLVILIVVVSIVIYTMLSDANNKISEKVQEMNNEQYNNSTKNTASKQNISKNNYSEQKILSVNELVTSNISENEYVKVVGVRGECIQLKVAAGYEGVPSGCRLYSNDKKNVVAVDTSFIDIKNNKKIIVEGNTVYCGGKKRKKYICLIKNAKIVSDKNDKKTEI